MPGDMKIEEVELDTFPDPYIAEVVAGFLKDAGIPAFVRGAELEDPVAAARRVQHSLGCKVFVPKSSLREAREVLEECRREGRLHARDGEEEEAAGGAG
jgi:hypothetical protein